MKIESLNRFEEILNHSYSIQDQIHLGIAYYVYCDLKIKEVADLDKMPEIKNQILSLVETLISSKNLEELKQRISGGEYNDKLKRYIDLVFAQKTHFMREMNLSEENDERIVRNVDEFLPFAKKQDGIYEGYIAIKKLTNKSLEDALSLFLFKRPNINMELYHEVYMVKLHSILVSQNSSYEIFLALEGKEKIINRNNIYVVVKLIENVDIFRHIVINNLEINKPINLIKNLFAYGMLGNSDLNLSNIIYKNLDIHIIYFIDPCIIIGNRNCEGIENDISLEIISFFKIFIKNELSDIKIKYKIRDIFIKYFNFFRACCLQIKTTNIKHQEFIVRIVKECDQMFEQQIIEYYLNKFTDEEVFNELLEIKNNIDFDKIDALYKQFENSIIEGYFCENIGLGMNLKDYHKTTKNILQLFKAKL